MSYSWTIFQDFIVINQPFLKNVTIPTLPNGNHDFTYLSLDCFHLSQKGYAIGTTIFFLWLWQILRSRCVAAINALWNNMLQPEGKKWTNWKQEFTEFLCPTPERPYITTRRNSWHFVCILKIIYVREQSKLKFNYLISNRFSFQRAWNVCDKSYWRFDKITTSSFTQTEKRWIINWINAFVWKYMIYIW